MKKLTALFLMLMTGAALFADDKAPVAVDDYTETIALQTITIRVLDNDYSYENNPVRILNLFTIGTPNGDVSFNDSLVFYTPKIHFRGVDSLRYRILDMENGKMSQFAKIYITVSNDGIAHLDLNDVHCLIKSNGQPFFDGIMASTYEVPAGSGAHSIFTKGLWMGGFAQDGQLHVAGDRYRILNKTDYYQGPVSDTMHYDQEFAVNWNRVWKLTKEDIEYHRANYSQPGYEPIPDIWDWPGNGDTELGQAALLAPFWDWNGDGIYDPMAGDFPLITGDQAIYAIFNDDGEHTESGGKRLGVEIHAMYYAYDQPEDSALSQTVFGSFNLINRSQNDYSDFYAAFFVDFDIGHAWDDYVGCDTTLHSAFAYNGHPTDGTGGLGTYGEFPPAQSFTCLNFNMDAFIYFNNTASNPAMSDPQNALHHYNYMQSMWRDSTHVTYGGDGYGGDVPVNFMFTGHPGDSDGWTEVTEENPPGDRRGLIVTGPYQYNAGDTLNLDFALVFARDYQGDHLSSVALLKERIQQVRDFYQEALSVEEIQQDSPALKVYPNPFTGELFVVTTSFGEQINWHITDISGSIISQGKQMISSDFRLDLTGLRRGVYFLYLNDGRLTGTAKLIKTE
jgi:hypothetical protein